VKSTSEAYSEKIKMEQKPVGRRIASIAVEGKGYFFTSLGFITAEHLKQGLFIGNRRSDLTKKLSVPKIEFGRVNVDIMEVVDDCDVISGSNYCGPELQVAKELGSESFLRYMDAFCPSDTMFIYEVKDIESSS